MVNDRSTRVGEVGWVGVSDSTEIKLKQGVYQEEAISIGSGVGKLGMAGI